MDNLNNEAEQDEQKSTHSGAGEVIASSPDLTTQILLHLSPSLVASLKLVSKQWLSIIIDPHFIKSHALCHPPSTLSGLFIFYIQQEATLIYDYVPFHPFEDSPLIPFVNAQKSLGLTIVQSCNGFLLCRTSLSEYYICNPTTLRRKKLPLPGYGGGHGLNLYLAFEPLKSPHYKVVCSRRLYSFGSVLYQLDIYSSETGLWQTLGEPFQDDSTIIFDKGVFCNGAIHWLTSPYGCLHFHVDDEWMKSTPGFPISELFPEVLEHVLMSYDYFGESNGRLYLVVNMPLQDRFTLFEMEEDYSAWFIKYDVHYDVFSTKFPTIPGFSPGRPRLFKFFVLSIIRDGCENVDEDVRIILSVPDDIVFISTKTGKSNKIGDKTIHSLGLGFRNFVVHEYIEALCPVL